MSGSVPACRNRREQSGGVARELVPSALRVEKDLAEGEARLNAERVRVRGQVRAQLAIRRLGRRSEVLGDELQLLPQPAADDHVVLIQAEGDRLADVDLLADVVADQSLALARGGRTLPGTRERRDERLDPALRDDDVPGLRRTRIGHEAICAEDRRAEQQEMEQRLSQDFHGVYQIGDV